jgi:hypothetical protein
VKVCNHHWIGGTPHTISARTISPKGERSRELFDVLDAAGERVDTYTCEEEATESAARLGVGLCSECGTLRERAARERSPWAGAAPLCRKLHPDEVHCEACGALSERLTYTPDDVGLCGPCARENALPPGGSDVRP